MRRARGRYAICTNLDIIFSDKLCRWLKEPGNLREGVVYRNNRYDCTTPSARAGAGQTLEFCEKGIIRKNTPFGAYVKTGGNGADAVFRHSRPLLTRAGKKTKAWMEFLHRQGAELSRKKGFLRSGRDVLGKTAFLCVGAAARLKYERDSFRCSLWSLLLHCHACGDFTLLDIKSWRRLGGYHETPCFSWGIDSLLLFAARANGFGNRKLPR